MPCLILTPEWTEQRLETVWKSPTPLHPSLQSSGRSVLLSRSNMVDRESDVMCSRTGYDSASGSGYGPNIDCSWFNAAPVCDERKVKKRRRVFCLRRTRSRSSSGEEQEKEQEQQSFTTNNNMPFMIHSHISKEIKHICRNCRAAEPLDGEAESGVWFTLLQERMGLRRIRRRFDSFN